MTAAMIVKLAQEGKLRFDDPISKYVEGVPNGDNITISELLKMRSGLYNSTTAPEIAESLDQRSALGVDDLREPIGLLLHIGDDVLGLAGHGRAEARGGSKNRALDVGRRRLDLGTDLVRSGD